MTKRTNKTTGPLNYARAPFGMAAIVMSFILAIAFIAPPGAIF